MMKNNCIVCGDELIYFKDYVSVRCSACGREFTANVICSKGHYICDECHSSGGISAALSVCSKTALKDPVAIINSLFENPLVHMHGPEHHILVALSLLAAYINCGGDADFRSCAEEIIRRGKGVPGGTCGFWGCCGAAVSTGIFFSTVTGTTPLSRDTYGDGMLMTSEALKAIGKTGGPRCCKRNSYLAIMSAADFTEKHLGIKIRPEKAPLCTHSSLNMQCLHEDCPFYRG